jgi:hypothetical protein
MSAFENLRANDKSEFQFETLALRYRRLARDYASVCRSALSDGAIWDGVGKGASQAFWLKMLELEHKREGVRVGVLGDMLNSIETASEDDDLVELVIRFAEDQHLGPENAQIALQAEMLRQLAVTGISLLKKEAYGDVMGPYSDRGPSESALLKAKEVLRKAVELDQR